MQKQDRSDYIRRKTGRIYSIKIEPECNELINKHKGKYLLFNYSEKYANPENFYRNINKHLKSICTNLEINKITLYTARHSWATFAHYLDISEDAIRMSLGHGKKIVTDIYINKDLTKIEKANRTVIDYLYQNGGAIS